MTHDEFKAGRLALGLTKEELADLFRVSGKRTIEKWEYGEREVPGPAAVLMALILVSGPTRVALGLPRRLLAG